MGSEGCVVAGDVVMERRGECEMRCTLGNEKGAVRRGEIKTNMQRKGVVGREILLLRQTGNE